MLVITLWHFQPNNVIGIQVPSQVLHSKKFPFQKLESTLQILFADSKQFPNYDALIANPQPLYDYLGLIADRGPQSTPHRFIRQEERLAYALNAYQAALIAVIIQHCPLKDLATPYWFHGLFWRVGLRVDGRIQSINDLAAEVADLSQGDWRVYLALNKGITTSLPMSSQAWTPTNITNKLQALEKQLLQEGPWLKLDRDQKSISLSGPFIWYENHFESTPFDYVKKHSPYAQMELAHVQTHAIDWTVRGQCSQALKNVPSAH